MSDLSPQGRKAMKAARMACEADGRLIGDCPEERVGFQHGFVAGREYNNQHEEELEHQLGEAKRFHTNEYKDRIAAEKRGEKLQEALQHIYDFAHGATFGDTDDDPTYIPAKMVEEIAHAALAENGDGDESI